MKISVVIPCFNHGAFLQRAINSALPQCHEVFVVDDGSTDATPDVLKSYEFQPKVKHIRHKKNQGVCAARNAAIAECSGDWLIPLDADDTLANNVIPTLRAAVNSLTFAYGDWLEIDSATGYHVPKSAPPIGMINRKNVAKATFLFSRSMWETVGGYDADYETTGGEDWAFMLALVEAGYHGMHVELPVYHYEPSQDGRAAKVKQHEVEVLAKHRQKYPRTMRNAILPDANAEVVDRQRR